MKLVPHTWSLLTFHKQGLCVTMVDSCVAAYMDSIKLEFEDIDSKESDGAYEAGADVTMIKK